MAARLVAFITPTLYHKVIGTAMLWREQPFVALEGVLIDVNRPCHKLAPSLRPSKGILSVMAISQQLRLMVWSVFDEFDEQRF